MDNPTKKLDEVLAEVRVAIAELNRKQTLSIPRYESDGGLRIVESDKNADIGFQRKHAAAG